MTLQKEDVERYSRQLLLPEIGRAGQEKIAQASVLVVGAGGLGSPAAMYLAAAGVGHLGIIDYDVVECNNLHRQVIHKESALGKPKVDSAIESLTLMNSSIRFTPYNVLLAAHNAMDIVKDYDIILDATDNVATRYLLNDVAILSGKPLVSGAALRFDGQLTVYAASKAGPCFRCIFPEPPPPQSVMNCSDAGVPGPVTGVIGSLQALETIKIIVGIPSVYIGKMLLFNGLAGTFRTVNLRGRRSDCDVCGDTPKIRELVNYELFCGSKANDTARHLSILRPEQRITAKEYFEIVQQSQPHFLLDVRSCVQFDICAMSNSVNIPLDQLEDRIAELGSANIYITCRRGNDSQLAVALLAKHGRHAKDIIGGITAYALEIDHSLPIY